MRCLRPLLAVGLAVVGEVTRFVRTALRSRTSLVAENLFLRKQLAYYQEHKLKPQPLTDAARFALVLWSRMFDWKSALVVVKPDTLIGWHRKGFQLFWRWKSRPGRPSLPREIRELIVRRAKENPTWGQMRVAAELSLKLAILVSQGVQPLQGRSFPVSRPLPALSLQEQPGYNDQFRSEARREATGHAVDPISHGCRINQMRVAFAEY
jgi:hypothetical protein